MMHVRHYIMTGTPGSGKTTILDELGRRGFTVVAEAATDVIASAHAAGEVDPHWRPDFTDRIVQLQRSRQLSADRATTAGAATDVVHFYDRSPVCTLVLGRFLAEFGGTGPTAAVQAEVDQVLAEALYEPAVLFVRTLGFVEPTAARRISFEESLRFERLHEEVYRSLGFELVDVTVAPVSARVDQVLAATDPSSMTRAGRDSTPGSARGSSE
jgi:predicted ATPase